MVQGAFYSPSNNVTLGNIVVVDELDKNHRENQDPSETTADGRIYGIPGEFCICDGLISIEAYSAVLT